MAASFATPLPQVEAMMIDKVMLYHAEAIQLHQETWGLLAGRARNE